MVDEESTTTWFSPAEDLLPLPEELTPLSQTLITPDLALAFDIHSPTGPRTPPSAPPPPSPFAPSSQHTSADYDSGDICSAAAAAAAAAADEPARTLKRPRLVWTPQLHKRFVEAVAHLGIKNAVPKTIMQLMNVDGLTRENVASHLQKYRLYLKRMQGLPSAASSGASSAAAGGGGGGICHGSVDAATDHLFASSPVPPHFLQPSSDHFLPIVSVQQQQQYQVERGRSGYRVGVSNRLHHHHHHHVVGAAYSDDVEIEGCSSGGGGGGRRVLTLFPSGDD